MFYGCLTAIRQLQKWFWFERHENLIIYVEFWRMIYFPVSISDKLNRTDGNASQVSSWIGRNSNIVLPKLKWNSEVLSQSVMLHLFWNTVLPQPSRLIFLLLSSPKHKHFVQPADITWPQFRFRLGGRVSMLFHS